MVCVPLITRFDSNNIKQMDFLVNFKYHWCCRRLAKYHPVFHIQNIQHIRIIWEYIQKKINSWIVFWKHKSSYTETIPGFSWNSLSNKQHSKEDQI